MRVLPCLPRKRRLLCRRIVKTSHVLNNQSPSSALPPAQMIWNICIAVSGFAAGSAASCAGETGCCAETCGCTTACAGCRTTGAVCAGSSTRCTGAAVSSAGSIGSETSVPGRHSFTSTTSQSA